MAKRIKLSIEAEAQKADDEIMALCRPDRMSAAEAVDFLERVIERCRSALDALHDENPDLRD